MDAKERDIVLTVVDRLRSLNLDEQDVLVLLIMIRDHSNPVSALRELAHFVAHRKRNRGDFHQFITRELDRINTSATMKSDGISGRESVERLLNSSPVYSSVDLVASIEEVFLAEELGAVKTAMTDAILLSIMSLLQDCRFDNDAGNEVGKLLIAFNDSRIALLAQVQAATGDKVIFTLISIENKHIGFASLDSTHAASIPNNFISVSGAQGQIVIHSQ